MNNKEQKDPKKQLKNWAIFSGIGIQMGITIYLGNLLGIWLDKNFSTTFLENTLTLTAVFLSIYIVVLRVNKFNNK
ncbi:MAG: AtpZ/AtpI family protein [Flavobacteriaceae bacterium]